MNGFIKVIEPDYPHLDAVKEMFWSTWEEINQNEFGNMGTRSVRNTMKNILTNEEFWSMMDSWVSKRIKTTHDKTRADARIQFCNTLTEALTSPVMTDEFGELADSVYEAVVQIKSNELEQSLQLAIDIVNGDKIFQFMDMVLSLVLRIDLDPEKLTKYFNKFKSTVTIGGRVYLSDGISNQIMKIGSTLNGQSKTLAKTNSARSTLQRSASAHF